MERDTQEPSAMALQNLGGVIAAESLYPVKM